VKISTGVILATVSAAFFLNSTPVPAADGGLRPQRGAACTVTHAGGKSSCQRMSGTKGTLYFVADEKPYKTCARTGNQKDTCVEAPRATHTLTLYSDAMCAQRIRRIIYDENRCDFKK